jgi:DHA2 family multidrug resistance protein
MIAQPSAKRRDVTEHGIRLVLIVTGVMLAALMQTLDSTITNVALPNIQGNLGASQDEGTWIVTAYTVAAIVIIPLTPWMQNRFGRKTYFVSSIVGFTVFSVICGSSDNLVELIVARAIQGAFGGGLLAMGQAIIRDTFPPKQLGLSQGIFAIGAIMGPALGPPLGGVLVDNATWNWVFDINVVPGVISAGLLITLLRDPDEKRSLPIDVVGIALLIAMLGSLQYVITEGEQHYWLADPVIAALTTVCAIATVAFIFWELNGTQTPVVDLRVLKNRSVASGTILSIALGVASLGSSYTLPQLTQGPLGFTPTESGMLFLVRAVPILFATLPIVFLATKIDARVLVGSGFLITGVSSIMLAQITTLESSFGTFVVPLILSGIGLVTLFIPLSIAVLGGTTPEEGPKATSFLSLAQQLGGSIGVAAMSVIIDEREAFHSTILGAEETIGTLAHTATNTTVQSVASLVYDQSTIMSYADATYAIAALAFVSLPLVLLLRKPKKTDQPIEMGG